MYIIILFIILILILYFDQSINHFFIKNIKEADLELFLSDHEIAVFQKKRLDRAIRILILLIFLPLVPEKKIFLSLLLLASIYSYKQPYYLLKKEYNKQRQIIRFQFPIWIRQIQVLLSHNNVSTALEHSLATAPDLIAKELANLVKEIKTSPNNYEIYNKFMSYYNIIEINRAMKLLFHCQLNNQNESIHQLQILANTTTKWLRAERQEQQKLRKTVLEWTAILPLIGVTIVFIGIMFNLLNSLLGKGG